MWHKRVEPGAHLVQIIGEEARVYVQSHRGRSMPQHALHGHYTSNDEVRQEFTIIYRAEYASGSPTPSDESTDVEWVPVSELSELQMDRSQRLRIDWALTQSVPRIDPDEGN